MPRYLLSVHTPSAPSEPEPDATAPSPPSEEEQATWMAAIDQLEAAMHESGTWVFSARLHGPETTTVVRHEDGETLLSDGPYAESKEHLAGFYIIDAADLDAALQWGDRVSETVRMPIEVRPFADWKA